MILRKLSIPAAVICLIISVASADATTSTRLSRCPGEVDTPRKTFLSS